MENPLNTFPLLQTPGLENTAPAAPARPASGPQHPQEAAKGVSVLDTLPGRPLPLQSFTLCSHVCSCSVPKSRPTVCDPMNCPQLSPEVYSDSCPSSRRCHPTISSSVVPFSSRLQSFPASELFPVSQFFASSGQSIGATASASVLPMNIQG